MSLAAVHDAGPPFADDDADIILRSSDNADFRTHKLLLSKASTIFRDMFSAPISPQTPPSTPSLDETKDGLTVVQMSEDEPTLKILLSFCYPAHLPDLSRPVDLRRAFAVGHKFEIEGITNMARSITVFLLKSGSWHPELVFAVGWQFRMKDVVVQAARKCLEYPMFSAPSHAELEAIPATAMYILERYRRQCVRAVTGPLTWIKRKDIDPDIVTWRGYAAGYRSRNDCSCAFALSAHIPSMVEGYKLDGVPRWFSECIAQAITDLQRLPCESTVTALSLVAPAIQTASQCRVCSTTAAAALERFSQEFAQNIKTILAKVKLETPF
ncbi:hypothetical protein OF83DRAFT_1180368 [Amylostereum chailletii]|nr:hypothetical protein OF83DRAFT_1180368 [Amylostereum chailletii]